MPKEKPKLSPEMIKALLHLAKMMKKCGINLRPNSVRFIQDE